MTKLRINGIVKLKVVVEKLQKSRLLLPKKRDLYDCDEVEDCNDSTNVPKDVKKGHFAVIAVDDDELKRFVLPISVLTQTWFMRLLEQAAEEYGFIHEGALTVPCRPSELERILREHFWMEERESNFLLGSSTILVNSC